MTTHRLTLRRARPPDAAAVFRYRSTEAVARWLMRLQTDPSAWAAEWETRVSTTVIVECDEQVIGDARLVRQTVQAQAEVATQAHGLEAELMCAFDPAWHGYGYATEAVAALIEIAFDELPSQVAVCYADNVATWNLMERVGMRRQGHSVRSTTSSGAARRAPQASHLTRLVRPRLRRTAPRQLDGRESIVPGRLPRRLAMREPRLDERQGATVPSDGGPALPRFKAQPTWAGLRRRER